MVARGQFTFCSLYAYVKGIFANDQVIDSLECIPTTELTLAALG